MSLRVDLINSRQFYHPGEHVQGNVTLESRRSEDIAQVIVEFTGRCKVKVRRHDHYTTISHRTRGYYFRLCRTVYDGGSYTFQSGTRSWPFGFTIPLEAESEDPRNQRPLAKRELDKIGILKRNDFEGLESDYFSSSPTWRGSYDNFRGRPDPHRLPDTFEYVSNRFPASCEARVEYELTVVLKRPTRGVLFPLKDLEASHSIILRTRNFPGDWSGQGRKARSEETKIVKIQQDFAAAQFAFDNGAKLSLLNRAAMTVFKPNDRREVNMDISVLLDCHLRPSDRCTFALQASLKANPSAQAVALPPIKLRSYTLRLIARTALRAKLEAMMVQDVNHYAVDSRVVFSDKGLDLDVPVNKGDVGQETHLPDASIASMEGWLNLSSAPSIFDLDRQFMTPTFKTYNISREYELAVEMKLECAGVKYDLKRENIAVTVQAEEDHVDENGNAAVRGGEMSTMQDRPSALDSKGGKEAEAADSPNTTDEKRDPRSPPLREEPEPLPMYEPGDVPEYHAEGEPDRSA